MKYLKRFNEELKPQTYRRAADKLWSYKDRKSGKTSFQKDRADALRDHAERMKWKEELAEYSRYGTMRVQTGNKTMTVHPMIVLDIDGFCENMIHQRECDECDGNGEECTHCNGTGMITSYGIGESEESETEVCITFFISGLAADEESYETMVETMGCYDTMGMMYINLGLEGEGVGTFKVRSIVFDAMDNRYEILDRQSITTLTKSLKAMTKAGAYPSGYPIGQYYNVEEDMFGTIRRMTNGGLFDGQPPLTDYMVYAGTIKRIIDFVASKPNSLTRLYNLSFDEVNIEPNSADADYEG